MAINLKWQALTKMDHPTRTSVAHLRGSSCTFLQTPAALSSLTSPTSLLYLSQPNCLPVVVLRISIGKLLFQVPGAALSLSISLIDYWRALALRSDPQANMVCERSVLRIFRIELGMNHLCPDHEVVAQLRAVGVLTQKNLTKKLNGVKNVLPRHEKAEVYTIWLREQRPSDPQIVAKTQEYCRYLSELRLGAVDVLDIWDACTRHIVESLDPTEVREKARVLHNITEMSHRIEDCFKVQDQNADITMSSKEKKKRTKNTKLQIKAEPALPRVKLETENNSLPCAGRIILQNQQNLSSASISSSRTRFGTSYGTLNTGVDATRSELQGRDNEPARVALDSHHSNSTGASADSASKIHPMFSFTPRHNPSPIFPARTLDSNRLSITSALSPTSIDLTHDQDHSRSNKTEYRSPGSLFIGDDSDDEMGNLPEGYVCKRCSEPGKSIGYRP